jgi:hypothetical protein
MEQTISKHDIISEVGQVLDGITSTIDLIQVTRTIGTYK